MSSPRAQLDPADVALYIKHLKQKMVDQLLILHEKKDAYIKSIEIGIPAEREMLHKQSLGRDKEWMIQKEKELKVKIETNQAQIQLLDEKIQSTKQQLEKIKSQVSKKITSSRGKKEITEQVKMIKKIQAKELREIKEAKSKQAETRQKQEQLFNLLYPTAKEEKQQWKLLKLHIEQLESRLKNETDKDLSKNLTKQKIILSKELETANTRIKEIIEAHKEISHLSAEKVGDKLEQLLTKDEVKENKDEVKNNTNMRRYSFLSFANVNLEEEHKLALQAIIEDSCNLEQLKNVQRLSKEEKQFIHHVTQAREEKPSLSLKMHLQQARIQLAEENKLSPEKYEDQYLKSPALCEVISNIEGPDPRLLRKINLMLLTLEKTLDNKKESSLFSTKKSGKHYLRIKQDQFDFLTHVKQLFEDSNQKGFNYTLAKCFDQAKLDFISFLVNQKKLPEKLANERFQNLMDRKKITSLKSSIDEAAITYARREKFRQ